MDTVKRFFAHNDGDLCPLVVKKVNDNRKYVVVSILGYECVGLLDGGACRTVVNARFAETLTRLGLKAVKRNPVEISVADGVAHQVTEVVDVPINFDDQFKVMPVMVMPVLKQNFVLGQDFFDEFGIGLRFRGKEVDVKGELAAMNITNEPMIVARESLTSSQLAGLEGLIEEMKNTVGKGLGRTDILKHGIDTGESKPIHQKQYNFSPIVKQAIEKELDEMLATDVVEPSCSPWCSPVLIVKKPNGENRLCLDSRQLNKVTKRDTYPLPRVANILDNLRNAKFLSTIDLKSAFWQIQLEQGSKEKTAFAVPGRGLFHFKVMPFGLVNASQTQQRLMDILFHAEDDKVWAYLDDIVICSATFEEHLRLLRKVMMVLKTANLTVNVDKCKFARPSLRYLGYIVDKDGLRTDPEKVEAILNFARPKTFTELKRFIGLASWYRRFVKDFSMVASPLHDLTKGKKKKLVWTEEAEAAWISLKTLLTSTPVMTCPDYTKPFVIQCDASSTGVGAVLCQKVADVDQPVAYLSRKLNDTEAKYSASERELLSVVFAIEKFRPYIDGTRFTVVTDHSALLWLHKMKDPHGRLARWAMKLQQFDFDIIHRPGKCHIVPDALSRGVLQTECEIEVIEILDSHKDVWYKNKVAKVAKEDINSSWTVSDGLLFKKVPMKEFPNEDDMWKLFVPEPLRKKVLQECHDIPTSGHLGIRKTYFRIKQKFFWHDMLRDVKQYVRACECCASRKVSQESPLGHMGQHREVKWPWQVVAMDFMGPFPKSKKCNTMLLVVTCLFSKFTVLFPLRTGKADKMCETLEKLFLLFGAPKVIVCDNGKQFESHLFKDLASKYCVEISYTPHYHPQSNPTERVNCVIGTMISSYITSKKHNEWDSSIDEIGHAIRTAVHETTRLTPSYLFFGRETAVSNLTPLPSAQPLIIPTDSVTVNTGPYLDSLEERGAIFKEVQDKIKNAHIKSSFRYNQGTRLATFEVGDIVWRRTKYLSNAGNKFMAKLAPKFDRAVVVEKLSDIVFRLNNAHGKNIGIWHIKDMKPYYKK